MKVMLDYGLDMSDVRRDLALPDLVAEGDELDALVPGHDDCQLPTPAEPFRVELKAPDGDTWTWGPKDAAQRIQGSALDFCLRVSHRRPLAATDLTAVGPDAQQWLEIARVFL